MTLDLILFMDATELLFSLISMEAAGQPSESLKPLEQSSPCWAGGNGLMRASSRPAAGTAQRWLRTHSPPLAHATTQPSATAPCSERCCSGQQLDVSDCSSSDPEGTDTWTRHGQRIGRGKLSNPETLKTSAQEKERCSTTKLSSSEVM